VKEILPGIYRWEHRFGPGIPGASLYVRTAAGPVVIDPLIPREGFDPLAALGDPVAVILTTHWHERDALAYEARFGVRRYVNALPDARESRRGTRFYAGERLLDTFRTLDLGGISPGETGLLLERDGGILIVGDALFNFEGPDLRNPLSLLVPLLMPYGPPQPRPAWLSDDMRLSRRQLDTLSTHSFAHLLPSHGEPLIGDALAKVTAALEGQNHAQRRHPSSARGRTPDETA
jgi:glyoxylase-like metal-dependent hydrolase (beta-lactamase superfamily II)